ncbi:hypothetical protein [Actinomadura roseirufa]|uniref:hypothetical protein n=1 Tax=Actinomadura roseirufa TaxID=2094049 RepID=UPI0010417280|nr:hypothetical protein [Actinomadura roseirufa]
MTTTPNTPRVICSPGPIVPGDLFSRHQTIAGLRALADFLEANPAVPVEEYGHTYNVWINADTDDGGRSGIAALAAHLGEAFEDRIAHGGHCTTRKTFGRIRYSAVYIPNRRMTELKARSSYEANIILDPDQAPDAA